MLKFPFAPTNRLINMNSSFGPENWMEFGRAKVNTVDFRTFEQAYCPIVADFIVGD